MPATLERLIASIQTTPRRVVVQYLDWVQKAMENRDPSPLNSLLEKMKKEIRANQKKEESVGLEAEQEFARLCVLFFTSAHFLIVQIDQLLQFTAAGKAYCSSSQTISRREVLAGVLTEQYTEVCLAMATVDFVEREFLGAQVLSTQIREGFSFARRDVHFTLKLLTGNSDRHEELPDPSMFAKQARDAQLRCKAALLKRELDFDVTLLAHPFLIAGGALHRQLAIANLLLDDFEKNEPAWAPGGRTAARRTKMRRRTSIVNSKRTARDKPRRKISKGTNKTTPSQLSENQLPDNKENRVIVSTDGTAGGG
jgi:hypothetical protein